LRLTLWYSVSAFLMVLLVVVLSYVALSAIVDYEVDTFLIESTSEVADLLRELPKAEGLIRREVAWAGQARGRTHWYLRIVDSEGTVWDQSPGFPAIPIEAVPTPPAAASQPATQDVLTPRGRRYRVAVAVCIVPGAPPDRKPTRWLVQMAYDRKPEARIQRSFLKYLWAVLGGAGVLCALVGYAIARRGLRPIVSVGEAMRRIDSSTLNQRLPATGLPEELRELSEKVNGMLERLDDSFRRISQFSADIAHELRTPVNNLRGEIEVALGRARPPEEYRETLASALEECERLSRLTERLLLIARVENPEARVDLELADVGQELRKIGEFFSAQAAETDVAFSVRIASEVQARVNRELFECAIGNLLANSLAHTPAGGRITLRLETEGRGFRVTVEDTGSGIAAEHLPHIFDRFYRVDPSRSRHSGGVGLGLAIVKSIAQLHRATISVSSDPGKGTRISLLFPLAGDISPTPLPS
jgi:two-component system heavy metal sensor histidine kinase CusS